MRPDTREGISMSTRIRGHLRSNVVGYIALFLVLTGGTASALNGSNTVFSDDIVNGEVKSPDVRIGAVTAPKLATGAVTNPKLAGGAVTTPKLADGAVTAPKLGSDSVNSGNIVNGSVGSADLAGEAPILASFSDCVGGTPWTADPGGGLDPHYWMDAEGIVHLDGAVSCAGDATEGGVIFSMPPKYRPKETLVRYGVLGGGLSLAQIAVVNDQFGADVVFDGGTNGSTTDDYISLDGITYRGSP
jgi:hypothetical protein